MTKRRKVPIKETKKRAHETAHWRTMADPAVQKLVSNLQLGWGSMGVLERGSLLRELAALGCSIRGLEKELGQSTTSIRRHIVLATLPEADRKAIDAGASATPKLRSAAGGEPLRRQSSTEPRKEKQHQRRKEAPRRETEKDGGRDG